MFDAQHCAVHEPRIRLRIAGLEVLQIPAGPSLQIRNHEAKDASRFEQIERILQCDREIRKCEVLEHVAGVHAVRRAGGKWQAFNDIAVTDVLGKDYWRS